jgi:hypothetical protein
MAFGAVQDAGVRTSTKPSVAELLGRARSIAALARKSAIETEGRDASTPGSCQPSTTNRPRQCGGLANGHHARRDKRRNGSRSPGCQSPALRKLTASTLLPASPCII